MAEPINYIICPKTNNVYDLRNPLHKGLVLEIIGNFIMAYNMINTIAYCQRKGLLKSADNRSPLSIIPLKKS